MTIEDQSQDSNFTTPGGVVLPLGARNPHQQTDLVHGGNADNGHAEVHIEQELVDYVAEHTVGGSWQTLITATDLTDALVEGTSPLWNDDLHYGYPHPPYNQFRALDGSTTWKWSTMLQTEANKEYHLYYSINWPQAPLTAFFGNDERPMNSITETLVFIGDGSLIEVGFKFAPNLRGGGFNDFNIQQEVGASVVPATCTDFIRFIDDGVITGDYNSVTGESYVVQGVAMPHCPIADGGGGGGGCGCIDEMTTLRTSVDAINTKLQALLDAQNGTMVNTGQPVITLPEGTWNKLSITQFLNADHYNHFVDTNSGVFAFYGYNAITFIPATNMTIAVHGLPAANRDYPITLQANGDISQLEDVDDFELVVPTGSTVDVSMTVWLTRVAA